MSTKTFRLAANNGETATLWRYSSAETNILDVEPNRINRFKNGEITTAIAWNHSHKVLVTGGSHGTVLLIAIESDAKLSPFYHGEAVTALRFSPTSRYLCAVSNSKITLWDLKKRKSVPLLEWSLPAIAICVDFDATQQHLVVTLTNGSLYCWEIRAVSDAILNGHVAADALDDVLSPLEVRADAPFVYARFIANAHDPIARNWLVTAEAGGILRVWDVSSEPWSQIWQVPPSGSHVHSNSILLAVSPYAVLKNEFDADDDMAMIGSAIFASASSDGTVNVFDAKTQSHLFQFKLDVAITAIDFTPDIYRLAVGDTNGTIQILDTRQSEPVASTMIAGQASVKHLMTAPIPNTISRSSSSKGKIAAEQKSHSEPSENIQLTNASMQPASNQPLKSNTSTPDVLYQRSNEANNELYPISTSTDQEKSHQSSIHASMPFANTSSEKSVSKPSINAPESGASMHASTTKTTSTSKPASTFGGLNSHVSIPSHSPIIPNETKPVSPPEPPTAFVPSSTSTNSIDRDNHTTASCMTPSSGTVASSKSSLVESNHSNKKDTNHTTMVDTNMSSMHPTQLTSSLNSGTIQDICNRVSNRIKQEIDGTLSIQLQTMFDRYTNQTQDTSMWYAKFSEGITRLEKSQSDLTATQTKMMNQIAQQNQTLALHKEILDQLENRTTSMPSTNILEQMKETMTHLIDQAVEPINKKIQSLHLEVIRQAHTSKLEMNQIIKEYTEELGEMYSELEQLRKENAELKKMY